MPKLHQRDKLIIFFLVFIAGLFTGLIITKEILISLTFADLLKLFTDISIAIFIALYIGNKINKNSKLLELRLQLVDRFESNINEIVRLYKRCNTSKRNSKYGEILELFSTCFFNYEIMRKNNSGEDDFTSMIERLKNHLELFHQNITDPLSKESYSGHEETIRSAIETDLIQILNILSELRFSLYQ